MKKLLLFLLMIQSLILNATPYTVNSYEEFKEKIETMSDSDTLILGSDIRMENNRDLTPLKLRGTIKSEEGKNYSLHIESRPVHLSGNTRMENINFTIKSANSATAGGIADGFAGRADENPPIIMNGYDLTLKDVESNMSTNNATNADKVKPLIVMGSGPGSTGINPSNRENRLTIEGSKKLELSNIIAGSLDSTKSTKSTIDIKNTNTSLKRNANVILGSEGNSIDKSNQGEVVVKTASRNINNFIEKDNENISLELNNVVLPLTSKLPTKLNNLKLLGATTYETENLTVKNLELKDTSKIVVKTPVSFEDEPTTGMLNVDNLNASENSILEGKQGFGNNLNIRISNITGSFRTAGDISSNNINLPENYELSDDNIVRARAREDASSEVPDRGGESGGSGESGAAENSKVENNYFSVNGNTIKKNMG